MKAGTKAAILKAITEASAKVGKDDTLVVYLVMQGATSGEKPCLFATDSTFKDRTKNALFASEIEVAVKGLKSEQFCVFLDFNLKAFESKESILAPNINEFVRAFMGIKEKDSDAEPPIGREVFMSGNGILPPLAVDNQGSFTRAVTDALSGKADTEGYEADGLVTVDEVQKYVEKAIPELIRDVAKTNEEKLQRALYFGRSAHFPLSHCRNNADMPHLVGTRTWEHDHRARLRRGQALEESGDFIRVVHDGVGVDPAAVEFDVERMRGHAADTEAPGDKSAAIALPLQIDRRGRGGVHAAFAELVAHPLRHLRSGACDQLILVHVRETLWRSRTTACGSTHEVSTCISRCASPKLMRKAQNLTHFGEAGTFNVAGQARQSWLAEASRLTCSSGNPLATARSSPCGPHHLPALRQCLQQQHLAFTYRQVAARLKVFEQAADQFTRTADALRDLVVREARRNDARATGLFDGETVEQFGQASKSVHQRHAAGALRGQTRAANDAHNHLERERRTGGKVTAQDLPGHE